MKKLLALLLAATMVFAFVAGCNKNDEPVDTNPDPKPPVTDPVTPPVTPTETYDNQVIIGTTTDPNGDIVAYWTNGATDAFVDRMVNGYATIDYDQTGAFLVDPTVVKDYKYEETKYTEYKRDDENKVVMKDNKPVEVEKTGKTMIITLNENMVYSNGEAVKASDYVGTVLLFSSKLILEAGATGDYGYYFAGYMDYAEGDNPNFVGVKLLGDYQFSVTLAQEYLPNFFELGYMGVGPSWMAGWLPADVTIADDGQGAHFVGDFTTDHCGAQIEDYRWHLTAFSGPYVCEKYDAAGLAYTLKINPTFLGNFEGQKAKIETIIMKKVEQTTMLDEIRTGSCDMLEKMTDGAEITEALDMVDQKLAQAVPYDRNGYGHITFNCKVGPTQFKEVRHAIAYLLDRNEFARQFTQGFGSIVHGPYGSGMWMTNEAGEQMNKLNPYAYSPEKAVAELEAGGWTLDKDGKPYSTGLRYKSVDGKLMPLTVTWASSEGNSVSDMISSMLAKNPDVTAAGMEVVQTVMTFSEMLDNHYYNLDEDYYCMFNLATNYSSPVYNQESSVRIDGSQNYSRLNDKNLYDLANKMNQVESSDPETYLKLWVDYQVAWNELLPALPLYSNQYYDLFANKIENYTGITGYWTMDKAIIYANVIGH